MRALSIWYLRCQAATMIAERLKAKLNKLADCMLPQFYRQEADGAEWTRLTPDWQPGTLIPQHVEHHHGMTGGMGEWIPNFASIATVRIDASGRWTEIFAAGAPTSADIVLIPAGVHVIHDEISSQAIKAIVVQGTLEFDPNTSTTLIVGTIMVEKGTLRIVPASNAVQTHILFSGHLNVNEDPRQLSLGLYNGGSMKWRVFRFRQPCHNSIGNAGRQP
jgi:hypothetical protein